MGHPNSPEALSVLGHLDELRGRILKALAALAGGTALGLLAAKPVIQALKNPAWTSVQEYVLFKPTEVVALYLKVGLYCGAILASPVILVQAWRFVRPAVPRDVKVSLGAWAAAAAVLFLGGTVFAYAVLVPAALTFLMGLSREVATPLLDLNAYISFVLAVLVAGGAVFELPLAMGLAAKLELVTPRFLRRKRKQAFFALCVVAAVITPTTDAFNMALFALPMLALYESGIWVAVLLAPAPKHPVEVAYREHP
jgi:sec-independent protein translocase protein TatC